MINAADLVALFRQALDDGWGYIWGTAGVMWTEALQKALEKTTDENRAMSRKYGSKWIGHYVADCSGMFVWAFSQYGMAMSHISSNIYISYCNTKGKLTADLKKTIKAGTAVFTGSTAANHPHVGLYVGDGDGLVIEAKGTQAGVITSKITDKKWTWYGELKDVNYGSEPAPDPPAPDKGYAIVTGKNLALREGPTTDSKVLARYATGTKVKLEAVPDDWEYVNANGKKGFMMKKYLDEGT